MSKLLTRQGARNLSAALDRVASVFQYNSDLLCIDKKIAMDFARRCDLLSDAVETTATINYPKAAAIDETGTSVEPAPGNEGFDANEIGDEVPGPLEIISPPAEPWMNGHFTQEKFVDLFSKQESGELAAAAAAGAKFAALLGQAERTLVYDVTVQGYEGFLDQIRQLSDLATQAQSLDAQIEALVGPLLANKKLLDPKIAKIHSDIKDAYKASLAEIGNVTLERKTALVEARAKLKVAQVKRSVGDVQGELLDKVAARYGSAVSAFIASETAALQDMNKNLRVTFQGFELENRASKTASLQVAGITDLLTRFQILLSKTWQKMVQIAQNAAKVVAAASAKVDVVHDEFMKTLSDSGKTAASQDKFAGFNLFD